MPKDCNIHTHPPSRGDESSQRNKGVTLPIYSVTPFTMLDFPNHTACIIWFSGCNMRCGYCHNPQIVKGKGRGDIDQVLSFLKKRQGLLDGIVLSGGEASIYPGLNHFVHTVKDMGYAIKLDTNGTRPDVIEAFLVQNLIDYIALDYKAPPEKFKKVTGIRKFEKFQKTLDILCKQATVPFEVRTTVHTALMNEGDVIKIMDDLESHRYKGTYYVQNYINNGGATLGFLGPQEKELDIKALSTSRNFPIEYRNF